MKSVKLGVQAMMLKGKVDQLGTYETLKKVNEIGYKCVEISQIDMNEANVAQMRKAHDDFGMEIAAVSAGVAPMGPFGGESLATHFDKIVADCRALNCSFIRIGMLPFNCMGSPDAVLSFCKSANVAAKKLADQGIKLYYHNHHIEFRKFNGVTMLDIIRENADRLGFELDVHWIQRGGMEPVKVIRDYAGKVNLIHLKDYRIGALAPEAFGALAKGDFKTFMKAFGEVVQFAELGEGNIDMAAVIEAGKESGAQYFFIEQDELYGRDVFDCLITSRDNIHKLGYEIV